MGCSFPAEQVGLPPAAIARRASGEDRHRAIARALHAGPPPRALQITEKLEGLRSQIAQFRARAIDLHVKLVELEAKGDPDVRALRAAMMASVVRIEGIVRALVETPDPADKIESPDRFAEGTRVGR
jgi:hypothetical protein